MPQTIQPSSTNTDTTSATESLWLTALPTPVPHPPLRGTQTADVTVIGGGIAGVTTALRLQQSGVDVVLLEAMTIGSGVTGCTTAKVTALQSTMLSTIARRHGREAAAVYAAASRRAVLDVAELATAYDVDCDLDHRPAVTYAEDTDALGEVRSEYDAAREAGLPVSWHDGDGGLPYPVAGAVWLAEQVAIQPVAYVRGLADAFMNAGGRIHEHSRAMSVGAGSPCRVETTTGAVECGQVIVATHFPVLDRGVYFARIKAERSYCVAVRVDGEMPRAMAISTGNNSRSIQYTGHTVIVGGEGHAAGAWGVDRSRFTALEEFASQHWPVREAAGRWSAQDPVPYDHLPMIGPYHPRSQKLWVATGWAKWGLTGGTFAARILSEAIHGRSHEWAPTFTPNRLSLRSTPEIAELGAKFSVLMAWDRITPAETSDTDEIPIGEARVLRHGLGKIGAYRDEGGALHGVSLRCTHLGCLLRFNGAERSWDCPCHGSRFDVDGTVLEGPAVHPLPRRDVT